MKKHLFLIGNCFCILLLGCGKNSENDTMPSRINSDSNNNYYNIKRSQLGLRQIGTNWVIYSAEGLQENWKIKSNGFGAKTIFKDNSGNIISEEDYYYSGKEFNDLEGHGWEHITVHYDYETKLATMSYTGTNNATKAILSKFLMPLSGPSADVSGLINVVKLAAAGWPDGPN